MDKAKVKQRLMAFLKDGIKKRNLRVEDICYETRYSFSSVMSWKVGRRVPKFPVLKHLEEQYHVKLL